MIREMSEGKWVLANGVRYPVGERQVSPWDWSVEKETFVHEGSEWMTIKNITVEEAMAIRDVERARKLRIACSGEIDDITDSLGNNMKWCKVTNYLYSPLKEGEKPLTDQDGNISEHYSSKINAMCVGKMVLDNGSWVPEDEASWNRIPDSEDED